MIVEKGLDIRDRPSGHFLVHRADDPLLDFGVEALLEYPQRLWRGNDRQCVEVASQCSRSQLVRGVLNPLVLLLLVEVGLFIGGSAVTAALLGRSRRVGLDLAIFAIVALTMSFGPKIDLIVIPVVAEEQHLAAVGDQNERIVGQGHERFLLWIFLGRTRALRRLLRHSSQRSAPWPNSSFVGISGFGIHRLVEL